MKTPSVSSMQKEVVTDGNFVKPSIGNETPTVLDLFCGAGGLSLGFQQAGFRILRAADSWSPAVQTYRKNLGDHVVCEEISEKTALPATTVIIGGPPCQGFSSAGRRRDDDERNSLVAVFGRIVARLRPNAFVFENVEGFLTGADGRFVIDLLEPVLAAGYRVHLRKINAANYGVPQHRKRVLAIGGLGWNPAFPEPTHTAHGAPGARLGATGLPFSPSIAEALGGLPSPLDQPRTAFTDHDARLFEGVDLERARLLQPGQTMRDLPEALWHDSFRRRAFRRVKDGTPTERRGGAPAGLRRLDLNAPSKAITGGALRDFLHPVENRTLTLRECARLQTFPDSWHFLGARADRAQLIGNAVPPRLAYHAAACLLRNLDSDRSDCDQSEGQLLSFVPTLSSGLSPSLEAVRELVLSRFARGSWRDVQRTLWD